MEEALRASFEEHNNAHTHPKTSFHIPFPANKNETAVADDKNEIEIPVKKKTHARTRTHHPRNDNDAGKRENAQRRWAVGKSAGTRLAVHTVADRARARTRPIRRRRTAEKTSGPYASLTRARTWIMQMFGSCTRTGFASTPVNVCEPSTSGIRAATAVVRPQSILLPRCVFTTGSVKILNKLQFIVPHTQPWSTRIACKTFTR